MDWFTLNKAEWSHYLIILSFDLASLPLFFPSPLSFLLSPIFWHPHPSFPSKNNYEACFRDSFPQELINFFFFLILLRKKLQHVNWNIHIGIHVLIMSGRIRSLQHVLINLVQKCNIPSILELLSYLIECHFWMTCYSNINQINLWMKCFHSPLWRNWRFIYYIQLTFQWWS